MLLAFVFFLGFFFSFGKKVEGIDQNLGFAVPEFLYKHIQMGSFSWTSDFRN